jgi:hypothetical protein
MNERLMRTFKAMLEAYTCNSQKIGKIPGIQKKPDKDFVQVLSTNFAEASLKLYLW